MGGNRGKLASMAGHAYLHAYWDAEDRFGEKNYPTNADDPFTCYPLGAKHWVYEYQDHVQNYRHGQLAKKVTLRVDTTEELDKFLLNYGTTCGVSLVKDAGLTVFNEPTVVCLGIGPIPKYKVEEDLRNLKVML